MTDTFEASIPDGEAKHFVFAGLDQYKRPLPLTLPLDFAGNDGQITIDGNGLGFEVTLKPGASSAFTVSQGTASTSIKIDSPVPVLTTIVVTEGSATLSAV